LTRLIRPPSIAAVRFAAPGFGAGLVAGRHAATPASKESAGMRETSGRLRTSAENDATVVEFTDRRILDEIGISEIGEQLNAIAAQADVPKMVLDFANVAHMSSSALGMLITLHKRISEKSGQLRLCNIQPSIHEVFVITRLNEIFTICQSRQEALDSLS
jgi:anti-sigma B factor antagonist